MAGRNRLQAAEGLPFFWEAFAGAEWLSLRTSAIYYGFGAPHGDGSPVILVPGLTNSDLNMAELFYWLRRIGYEPHASGFGVNFSCPDLLMRSLIGKIHAIYAATGRKVRLVGHSAGGTISRAAAVRSPALVAQVITLGSPVTHAKVHPAVLTAAELVTRTERKSKQGAPTRCYVDSCRCGFFSAVDRPLPPGMARAAIYTRGDGVVDWHGCLDDEASANYEVAGTHAGLIANPEVYRTLAKLLAAVAA